jgi:hypothetical protein
MYLGCLVGRLMQGKVHVQFTGVQESTAFMTGAVKLAGCGGGQLPLTLRADGAYHIDFLIKIRDPQICLSFLASIFTFRLRNLWMSNPEFQGDSRVLLGFLLKFLHVEISPLGPKNKNPGRSFCAPKV